MLSSPTEIPRRRRRPALACVLCRRRKIKCNRESPCQNCIRSKVDACVYETSPKASHGSERGSMNGEEAADIESMKRRIRGLESLLRDCSVSASANALKDVGLGSSKGGNDGQEIVDCSGPWGSWRNGDACQELTDPTRPLMSSATPPNTVPPITPADSPDSRVESTTSQMAGTFLIHHGDTRLGQSPSINRSITHKNRMFGQSHWFNTCILMVRDIIDMIDEHAGGEAYTLFCEMQKCKHLAKVIKARRTPEWPCSITSQLPSREVADVLLKNYFSTSETIYRVLHQPSFREQYEACWEPDAKQDPTFLVLLKLVLAIGSAVYDDKFTLRPMALRWVYEAETWLANPTLKHRLGFDFYQIYILLLLARERVGSGEDMNWISAGGLYRVAVHGGLHRDPILLPNRTILTIEMHRRLWNTILEYCLQMSLNLGMPPMMSLDDFDTQPPRNFNDDQLNDDAAVPRPDTDFTDTSIARELRNTFAIRLSITKFLNCIRTTGSYDYTLRLDKEFRTSYKALRRTFQSFQAPVATKTPLPNQLGLLDVLMLRYLVALHIPYFASSSRNPAYALSRKVVSDSALKIWYTLLPGSMASQKISEPSEDSLQLERLLRCSSGFFRSCMMQGLLVVSVELCEILKDDDGLGLVPNRPDLFAVLEEGVRMNLGCVKAGETNIKGYVFANLMYAHAKGIQQGLDRPAIAKSLWSVTIDAESKSLVILQDTLASMDSAQADGNAGIGEMLSFDDANLAAGEWNFVMPDNITDPMSMDFMAWMFDNEEVAEPTMAMW